MSRAQTAVITAIHMTNPSAPKDFVAANAMASPIITGEMAAGRVFGLKV